VLLKRGNERGVERRSGEDGRQKKVKKRKKKEEGRQKVPQGGEKLGVEGPEKNLSGSNTEHE